MNIQSSLRGRFRESIVRFAFGAVAIVPLFFACEREKSPGAPALSLEASLPELAWNSRGALSYAYELESRTTIGKGRVNRLAVKGELLLKARQNGPEQWELWYEISKSTFKREPDAKQDDYAALEAELNGARGSVTLERGKLSAQRVHQDASPVVANLIRTLVGHFQYPGAQGPKDAEEYDSTGRYLAQYEPSENSEVTKTKVRYLTLSSRGVARGRVMQTPLPAIDTAQIRYQFRDGQFVSIQGRESLKSLVNDAVALSSEFETKLQLLGTVEPPPWNEEFLQGTREWSVDEAHVDSSSAQGFDAARIGEFTYEEAVATLLRIQEESGGAFANVKKGVPVSEPERVQTESQLAEYQDAFAALAAILRREEAAATRAFQDILAKKPAAKLLVDALSSSGGQASQERLVALVGHEEVALELRGEAAFGLARSDHPIGSVLPALASIAHHPSLSEYGLFGIGTLARRLRESGDLKRAAEASALLRKELEATSSIEHRARVLNAISNSGDEQLLSVVRPHLASPHETVAVAAVNALRLMEGNEASGALSEALDSQHRKIRSAAIRGMKNRAATQQLVSSVASLVRSSPSPSEAVDAVRVLASWLESSPDARAALESLASSSDLREDVQEAVKKALSS